MWARSSGQANRECSVGCGNRSSRVTQASAPRRSARRGRSGASERRAARARAVRARRGCRRGCGARGVLAAVDRRGRGRGARRAAARPAVRGARQRHRPRRRCDAARRPGRHRHDPDEPRARGRPGRAGRVGRARRAEPRPVARGRATSGCTTRPIRRRSRPARSAATSPPTPAARTAWPPGVTSAHVLAVDVVLPDGEVARARRPRARRARLRPARAASSAPRARWASRPASRCASSPDPPAVATMLCAFGSVEAAAATVSGIDRGRRPPGRARDDGRAHHPSGRGLRRRGLSARRGSRAARRARRAGAPASPTKSTRCARIAQRARRGVDPRRGRRRGTGAALEGPQVGVRRDRPHRARLLPARRGRAAHQLVEVLRRVYEIADAHRAHHDERVPRRRRQPAPADRVRRARAGRVGSRARRGHRDPRDVHRRGRRADRRTRRRASRSAT